MSEYRKDPLNNGWVIIATERGKRPSDFGSVKDQRKGGPCAFCAGFEQDTPPEVLALRADGGLPDSGDWHVRVVPNKYAAVTNVQKLERGLDSILGRMSGLGYHEVVVETPCHEDHLCDLSVAHLTDIVSTYQSRMQFILSDDRMRYVQVFKNWGAVAGASMEHSHSQIIGLPVVPRFVKEQLACSRAYHEAGRHCLVCDIIDKEISVGERIVCENDEFVVIAPFASKFPFQLHVYPKTHHAHFVDITASQTQAFALVLKEVLFALRVALVDPPFNYLIHTSPKKNSRPGHWTTIDADYHWFMAIIPRLTQVAGFEWGTGFYINPTAPEDAAEFLREVLVPADFIR